SATSDDCKVFTVALVARGTNAGVRTSPWLVTRTPARAEPSRASILNELIARPRLVSWGGRSPHCLVLRNRALEGRGLALAVPVRLPDRDAARLALLRLGDAHLEHALVEVRADRVGVHALGQRERAAEAPERALEAVPVL